MSVILYSTCSPIDIGCVLEDGYGGFVEDGYYSNGVTWYLVSGGSGLVIDLGPCVTTTTTTVGSTTTTTTTTLPPGDVTYAGFFELVVDPTSEKAFKAVDVSITGGHFPLTNVAIGASSGTISVSGVISTGDKALKIGVPPSPTPMVIAEIIANGIGGAGCTVSTDTSSGYLKVIVTPNTAPSTVTLSGTLTVRYIAAITTTTTSTTTTTTTAYPYGDFELDPQYGINITSLTASTGTLPSFTFPRNSGSSQTLDMVSAYSNATVFSVGISGTRLFGTNKLVSLYVNSVSRACQVITSDGAQTKVLTSSVAILDTDNVTISIDNATSC